MEIITTDKGVGVVGVWSDTTMKRVLRHHGKAGLDAFEREFREKTTIRFCVSKVLFQLCGAKSLLDIAERGDYE